MWRVTDVQNIYNFVGIWIIKQRGIEYYDPETILLLFEMNK